MDSAGGGVKESWDGWEKGTCRHTAHGRTCCPTCVKNALQQVREEGERKGEERLAEAERVMGEMAEVLERLRIGWEGKDGNDFEGMTYENAYNNLKSKMPIIVAALASHAEYLKSKGEAHGQ